jgi:hypothetical protein
LNPLYTTTDWSSLQRLQTQMNKKSESHTSDVQKFELKVFKVTEVTVNHNFPRMSITPHLTD